MSDEEGEHVDPFDPETRYAQMGMFDESAYENDLEAYPDYFDENGWPLFGEYNPYALEHPITELSWYLYPKVPSKNESDPSYEEWFFLATVFESATTKLFQQMNGGKVTCYLRPFYSSM